MGGGTEKKRRKVVRKKHGLFCDRSILSEVLEKKMSSLNQLDENGSKIERRRKEISSVGGCGDGDGTTATASKWMFMVVELRYNKMLSAWVEASRGIVR